MKNTQIQSSLLPIMEHFYTIQGEGANSGKAAYFVRLGGCDVGCVWCDVKESWDASVHPAKTLDEIINPILETKAQHVVVTGGEPAMHDLSALTQGLKEKHLSRWIETSGAHPLTGEWDWVCLSPKKFKACLEENYPLAHELKVVIANKHDFAWAEKHAEKVNANCRLFLQPEWSRQEKLLSLIIDYVKENPKWEISLQTHKFMQIP